MLVNVVFGETLCYGQLKCYEQLKCSRIRWFRDSLHTYVFVAELSESYCILRKEQARQIVIKGKIRIFS